MSIKKQIENYFKYNLEVSGDFLFFDEKLDYVNSSLYENKKHTSTSASRNPANELDNLAITNNIKNETEIETKNKIKQETSSENILLDLTNISSLDELQEIIRDCQNCSLGATRNKLVFGSGNPNADLLIIGEAPGADEDLKGEPFVGRAGQLLTDILLAINFKREDVYIANICKCRPPGNRRPSAEEVYFCEHYLKKQIELISPKFILALGLTAADALFKKTHKMADVRGHFLDYHGIKTIVTYHPAALLRNPAWKRPVWEDVQLLRKMYDASK